MSSSMDQLRALPTVNLSLYMVGLFAVMASMAYMHGIKPAYLEMKELQSEQQQLNRLVTKFDLDTLNLELRNTKDEQEATRDSMFKNIPDRDLSSELPTILESLHHAAKTYGLRTQKIEPSEIETEADISTVSLEIQVVGKYHSLYTWIESFSENSSGVSVSDIRATQSPNSSGSRTLAMNMVIYGR